MKLRRRVMIYILAVMTIVLFLLAAMVISDVLKNEQRIQETRAQVAVGMIKNYIRQSAHMQWLYRAPVEPGHLPTDLQQLAENMVGSGLIGAIRIERDGAIVASVPETEATRRFEIGRAHV